MKRRWTTIADSPIHLQDDETPLGYLKGVFMHPETGQIIAFLAGITKVLSPVDIEKWCKYSIQINRKNALVPPHEILRIERFGLQKTFLNGKKVLSKAGHRMGKIRDFTIDTRTTSILTFSISKRFLGIEWDKRIFPYKDISEVTEKAIILTVEPEDTERIKKPAIQPAQAA